MHIDDNYWHELGIDRYPDNLKTDLIEKITAIIQTNVGLELVSRMTDAQVAEFNDLNDDQSVMNWLEQNIPDYQDTVVSVMNSFKNNALERKERILSIYNEKHNPSNKPLIN